MKPENYIGRLSYFSGHHSRRILATLLLVLFSSSLWAQQSKRYEYNSRHMGTLFRIVLYAPSDSIAQTAAQAAFQHIEKLNGILSDYIPESELNRLSRTSGKDTTVSVSSTLFSVLQKAQKVSRKTDGAFDITVGPYVQLWRTMQNDSTPDLPTSQQLKKAREQVGYRHIKLNKYDQTVRLTKPGMQLDLGGIAKGFAVDEALRVLQKYDIRSALVDGGGDIAVGEAPPGKEGWSIRVQTYDKNTDTAEPITLILVNKAVATSGDLYQHIEIDGKRYSHIIDPRTGLGITDQTQVTVVAPDGITADSYASAVSVSGPNAGLKLIENRQDLEAYIEQNINGSIAVWESDSFEKLKKKSCIEK